MTKVKVEVKNLIEEVSISVLKRRIAKQIERDWDIRKERLEHSNIIGWIAKDAIEEGSERVILCKDTKYNNFFHIVDTKDVRSYLAVELGKERIPQIFIG